MTLSSSMFKKHPRLWKLEVVLPDSVLLIKDEYAKLLDNKKRFIGLLYEYKIAELIVSLVNGYKGD